MNDRVTQDVRRMICSHLEAFKSVDDKMIFVATTALVMDLERRSLISRTLGTLVLKAAAKNLKKRYG